MPRRSAGPGTSRRALRLGTKPAQPRQVVLHVALEYIEPLIWRRVRVPENYTLHQLHRVLQLIFSWLDYHLFSFEIGNRRFERPDRESEAEDASRFTLADLGLKARQRFTYTYDFGDDWRHAIKVESFLPMPGVHEFDWSPRLDPERSTTELSIGRSPWWLDGAPSNAGITRRKISVTHCYS